MTLNWNASKKIRLIKIMAGEVEFQSGERDLGHNCRIGYFSQHRAATLDPEKSVLDECVEAAIDLTADECRGVLGSFLFRKEDVFKKTKVLSGGEKSRLNLVKFLDFIWTGRTCKCLSSWVCWVTMHRQNC